MPGKKPIIIAVVTFSMLNLFAFDAAAHAASFFDKPLKLASS